MFRNYLLIALRNIIRQKTLSIINILGLSLGLACTILIIFWVQDELSYDSFHDNIDELYRVEENQHYSAGVYHVNVTPYPAGPVWREEIPEIINATRYSWMPGMLFRAGDEAHFEESLYAVDSTFLEVFTFPLKYGDPATALDDPNSLVISEKMAQKYFGDTDPVGKDLMVNNTYLYKVSGVFEPIPSNSSLQFEALFPFDILHKTGQYNDHWGSNSIFTYVQVPETADHEKVNEKLTQIVWDRNEDSDTDFLLAPFDKMHLHSYFGFEKDPGFIKYVYIFSIVAAFVLLIACINFMNLYTARSANRAREIGMRKVVGARRGNLVVQFFGEALLMAIISALFALVLVQLFSTVFNSISGKNITFNSYFDLKFGIALIAITLITGLISGIYPSIYLSAFNPVRVIKGETGFSRGKGASNFRKVLVVFQFSISIFLIIGTIVVYNQLNYMRTRDIGYEEEMLMYIPMRGEISDNFLMLREEFSKEPYIRSITATMHSPHHIGSNTQGVNWPGMDPELEFLTSYNVVAYDYAQTFGMEFTAGRDFSRDFPADRATDSTANFIINETLARIIGKEEVLGSEVTLWDFTGRVVGIVKDFNFQSLHSSIEPLILGVTDSTDMLNYMVFRLESGDLPGHMKKMERKWDELMPGYPFDYSFVDEDLDRQYRTEERMSKLLQSFTVLAIVIACLGLFGLVSYMAERRTREIGIRKVMGASVQSIIAILSRQFVLLILIASVIGCSVAWIVMRQFLQDYAYRTELSWWIFALTVTGALVLSLLTISYQAIKAALANPADSLRYE